MRDRRRGAVMQQMLICLLIVVGLLPIVVGLVQVLVHQTFFEPAMQDEIGLAQLRRVMNVCYQKQINQEGIICKYQGQEVLLSNSSNHLFLQPGTWIFLTEVDDVEYYWEGSLLMMRYSRANHSRDVVIASE